MRFSGNSAKDRRKLGELRGESCGGGRKVVGGERRGFGGREHANEIQQRGIRLGAIGLEARAAEHHESRGSGVLDDRAREPGLADPRVAGHADHAALLVARAVEGAQRKRERRIASDEQRADEAGGGAHSYIVYRKQKNRQPEPGEPGLDSIHHVAHYHGVPKQTQSVAAASRGRPRSEQARRAILKTAAALVEEGGYPALTVEAVADGAGVARTTIYRWWPNRAVLAVDVLVDLAAAVAPPPTNADPLRAIRLELRKIAAAASGTAGALLLALLGEAQYDADVRTALHQRVTQPRREASMRAIRAAQDGGELRDDIHPSVILDLLYGPIFYRLLMGLDTPTERFAEQVFERVLDGVGTARK